MAFNSSAIIILIVVAFAFYLVYSQNSNKNFIPPVNAQYHNQVGIPAGNYNQPPVYNPNPAPIYQTANPTEHFHQSQPCQNCEIYKQQLSNKLHSSQQSTPQVTNVMIENETDPYSDAIKKQDLYSMYDPLTYPQMRLPREILEKYNEYHDKNGNYPPFNQSTQPLFDNPILNGILIKQVDDNEPFSDNVPGSIPLFRVKSAKNTNRFFYYIIDQRYQSKIELKIPLDHIKLNGIRHNNADFYGLPEINDGDIIENIDIYPNSKFKITLYKTYHFP